MYHTEGIPRSESAFLIPIRKAGVGPAGGWGDGWGQGWDGGQQSFQTDFVGQQPGWGGEFDQSPMQSPMQSPPQYPKARKSDLISGSAPRSGGWFWPSHFEESELPNSYSTPSRPTTGSRLSPRRGWVPLPPGAARYQGGDFGQSPIAGYGDFRQTPQLGQPPQPAPLSQH